MVLAVTNFLYIFSTLKSSNITEALKTSIKLYFIFLTYNALNVFIKTVINVIYRRIN